jgi:hypothetical protein
VPLSPDAPRLHTFGKAGRSYAGEWPGFWELQTSYEGRDGITSAVEGRALAGSLSGDVRYNHFGPTMLPLLAYLPTDLTVFCMRW